MSGWSNGVGITTSRAHRSAIQGSRENSKHSPRSGIGTSKSRDFYGHASRKPDVDTAQVERRQPNGGRKRPSRNGIRNSQDAERAWYWSLIRLVLFREC